MNRYSKLLAGLLGISLTAASMMPLSADAEALCAVDPQRTVMQESGNETGPVTAEAAVETLMRAAAQREYIEGKAIAIGKGKKGPDTEGEAELISEVSPEAVSSAVNELEAGGAEAAAFASQRLQTAGTEAFSIWQISDDGRTTEQILRDLFEDPYVIIAEPEYMAYAAEEPETAEAAGAGDSASSETAAAAEEDGNASQAGTAEAAAAEAPQSGGTSSPAETASPEEPAGPEVPGPGDLSAMQWYLADTSDIYTTPLSPTGGYSLGVAGWREGRRNEKAPENAGGTICIMDTGIDTDHPDLQGVLYEFTEEQQKKYGCGRYGLNASGDSNPVNEQKAVDSHGTHVAGIIAANWNGEGVSGIANGVKIFSVNVFGGNGTEQDMRSVLKGFDFLVDCASEVNLKAVNCSWGTVQPQFALSVMIDELAKKGVNTVIASGNRYCDLDESIDLGSQTHNVSAIVVNAASGNGAMTDFSCWGQDSTDVFAPGGSIMSTVTHIIKDGEEGDYYSYTDNTRFYPEASDPADLPSGIERFDEETPGVRFFDTNPAMDDEAKEIGEINTGNGFDDKYSMALRLSALKKDKEREDGGYAAINGYVYMAIPVESAEDVRWIGVKTAMSDGFKPAGGIDMITCAGEDGQPAEIDGTCMNALKKGWNAGASYTIYQCQWSPLSYNVQGYIEASNQLHDMLEKGMSEEEKLNKGVGSYKDPGKIDGLYEWEDGDSRYVIARIGIGMCQQDSRQTEVNGETALLIDNVAVGDENAFAGSYVIMSGTSMAAPVVTGCLAVIARDEPDNASLTGAQLEDLARERAAKLLASVDYDESLAALCRTGARVNLHGQTSFTAKAPLIQTAEAQDRVLTVEGWFFGSKGKIEIDDREYEAKSWEDSRIEVNLGTLPGGSHVVKVTNEEGAVMRAVFSTSSETDEGARLFDRTLSLPIRDQAFIGDRSDRIYGPIAACGDRIYTMTVTAKYHDAQGMWVYDIKEDKWSRHSLPEEFNISAVSSGSLASLRERLYLYGSCNLKEGEEEEGEKAGLWRYEPYGDTWEKLDVDVPLGSGGICAVNDTLLVIGGRSSDQDDEDYDTHIFKVDLTSYTVTKLEGKFPAYTDLTNMKAAASGSRLYIYTGRDYEHELDTVSEGNLFRFGFNETFDGFEAEDLTDTLDGCLGEGLRTEYDIKGGGDEPSEHFAIAGFEGGAAIIGSATPGEDVHIIYDTQQQAEACGKASSFHRAFDPLAVCYNGTLYVIGYNTTEPDVMYFRADKITSPAAQETAEESSTAQINKYIGPVTIGLFAAAAIVLALLRKK